MKKAFTMIELIFVIVIIGILASIALPKLISNKQEALLSSLKADLRTIQGAYTSRYLIDGNYPTLYSVANMNNWSEQNTTRIVFSSCVYLDIEKNTTNPIIFAIDYNTTNTSADCVFLQTKYPATKVVF